MLPIRSIPVVLLAALLCACQAVPTRPSTAPVASASAPAWRGVAVLSDPAQAPRAGTLEVLLVSTDGGDIKPLAHAEFAVTPSTRIEFTLPADTTRDAASTQFGWRVWLRDASGRLRDASERIVVANRDATASIPLSPVAPR